MVQEKYLQQVKGIIDAFSFTKDCQIFLFGSSIQKERFGDLDLGIQGLVAEKEISKLKEAFKNSNLPYNVDVINFDEVSEEFKNNVFNNKIIWIKP